MAQHLVLYRTFRQREANADCLSVEHLDGLLTAVALTPEPVEPVEYIPLIWGPTAPEFADDIEENAIFDGIYARLDEISRDLRVEGPVVPVLDEAATDGGARDWARGFGQGMNIKPWHWDALINDDENIQLLAPIIAHLDDEDGLPLPTASGRAIDEVRREAAAIIPAALSAIDLFFEMRARQPTRAASRVGRNDLCPCGSGRKYKKCCLNKGR